MLSANLSYQILDWLSVSGRVRVDNANTDYTKKLYACLLYTSGFSLQFPAESNSLKAVFWLSGYCFDYLSLLLL